MVWTVLGVFMTALVPCIHLRQTFTELHQHPHLSPADTWKTLFESEKDGLAEAKELTAPSNFFNASKAPSHKEILRLLRENDKDTITIVAIGPLTNLALAASEDPETFLKVKEVVVMGAYCSVLVIQTTNHVKRRCN